jgi:hypothetical protein
VKYAKSFTSEGGEGLHAHLPEFQAFHVNGSMPTARREELLREFEDARKAVMSNARCLTEGVNVPAVDVVAFMSPKKSRIDIVQATGRGMRKSGRKKKGYILIPLFLQKAREESIEEAIERADFTEVWDVLQAMQEQDDELAEIIEQMQFEKGKEKAKGYDDQRFRKKVEVLGLDVSLDMLQRAVTVKCIERLGKTWDYRYGELVTYKREHGDCLVPANWAVNLSLATWVDRQRRLYEKAMLPEKKIKLLSELGFQWSSRHAGRWEKMYEELELYKEKYGDCEVPNLWADNKGLASWVISQRTRYKEGVLAEYRIEMLSRLGFRFEFDFLVDHWNDMYERLRKYKQQHGNVRVPKGKDAEDKLLQNWVAVQQRNYRIGELSKARIGKLEALGFIWDYRDEQWENMYERLKAYKAKYGDCNVSSKYDDEPSLFVWVNSQRNAYRENKIDAERQRKLDSIGFIWNMLEFQWEEMYQALLAYKKKNGHCDVTRVDENMQLVNWLTRQRQQHRRGKLPGDKIRLLEDIGVVWDSIEAHWEDMFQELVAYREKYGDCLVPVNYTEIPQLGKWVNKLRSRKSRLSEDKVKRLEEIGFYWGESLKAHWEKMFCELIAYRQEHGDCLVKSRDLENPELGIWVVNQRRQYRKGRIPPDRIKRLEEIGFVWDTRKKKK